MKAKFSTPKPAPQTCIIPAVMHVRDFLKPRTCILPGDCAGRDSPCSKSRYRKADIPVLICRRRLIALVEIEQLLDSLDSRKAR